MFKFKSIRYKIITPLVLLMVAVAIFMSTYFPMQQADLINLLFHERLKKSAETLALGASISISSGNPEGALATVDLVSRDESLAFLLLLDPDGGVLRAHGDLEAMQVDLERREQEFRTLAENIPDVIARFDRAFRYIYVNPAVEKIAGIPAEEFLGRSGRELDLPQDLVLTWHAKLGEVFASGRGENLEFGFPGPNGERYLQARFEPEPGGETVLAVVRDLTEIKQVEREVVRLERLRALGRAKP